MDYQFENLGDERFQELCHSLINKEFPNSQAYPVGQPDGGRDSVVYSFPSSNGKKEFSVYQVKYVRDHNKIPDVHKWLVETIRKEAPKVKKLIPTGAKAYFLLTNVKGTGHLNSGSIDKLNEILEREIGIYGICWWRDDLSRKLESDPNFLWSYPQILNGQDLLNHTIFRSLNNQESIKKLIVKSYLADQYEIDDQVKFKQIELQNSLFELFIDVPLSLKGNLLKNKKSRNVFLKTLSKIPKKEIINKEEFIYAQNHELLFEGQDAIKLGAARFLLDKETQKHYKRILLEGGPGQGKSTIVQFICQVHRSRWLEKTMALGVLKTEYTSHAVFLPIKIDLRHLALWLERKNPYRDSISETYFDQHWQKSLEAFLVAHFIYHSNIKPITEIDLMEILRESRILMVFDGFDEIANLDVRNQTVDFINRGLNRLQEVCLDLQVIITSRPAAFVDAESFPVEKYPHFELHDIDLTLIEDYVEKWIKASRLTLREGKELKTLVEQKIQLSHIRELAKSPMQLAIFISLLRTKGQSLPNKRTALYDSYIELFFDRESEKNETVRDNRMLIIDIHQYLAWILHSNAEQHGTNGIIQVDDLKEQLTNYLKLNGHSTDLAELFRAVEERVCALVSRVQGTFEFEVQPLREYFCAKYLFRTAPYSPPGKAKKGTKPERFVAIVKNSYWQNVLRFFAGCFDVGELPLLKDEIHNLLKDSTTGKTIYPYLIISQLLSDHVFTQSPNVQAKIIQYFVSGVENQKFVIDDDYPNSEMLVSLPYECGGSLVVDTCYENLRKFPKPDIAEELINLIQLNSENTANKWLEYSKDFSGSELSNWILYGCQIKVFQHIPKEKCIELIRMEEAEMINRLESIVDSIGDGFINDHLDLRTILFERIKHDKYYFSPSVRTYSSLTAFFTFFHIFYWRSFGSDNTSKTSLTNLFRSRTVHATKGNLFFDFDVHDELDNQILKYFQTISTELNCTLDEWQSSLTILDKVVEEARTRFGDIPIVQKFAMSFIYTIKRTKTEVYDVISDDSKSLCIRLHYASLKAKSLTYWKVNLSNSSFSTFVLAAFFGYADLTVIVTCLKEFKSKFENLNERILKELFRVSLFRDRRLAFSKSRSTDLIELLKSKELPEIGNYFLIFRIHNSFSHGELFYKYAFNVSMMFNWSRNWMMDYIIKNIISKRSNKLEYLKAIEEIYQAYKPNNRVFQSYFDHDGRDIVLSKDLAETIYRERFKYPRRLSGYASLKFRKLDIKSLLPVGQVAKQNYWFENT